MELIDTHCHLHFSDFSDPEGVLADARETGVTQVINVGTSLKDSRRAIDFAEKNKKVWATAGVHPHEATEILSQKGKALLKEMLSHPKIIAVGEIGLDYYRNKSQKSDQEKAFRAQIELGLKAKLPFVFHVRDAWDDFWKILDDYQGIKGVAHSFNSGPADLDKVLTHRLFVALNGIMTFTKDDEQITAAKIVPLEKLVLETDAPFLAPAPFRGQTCEPKHVAVIAEFLANLRGESLEELAGATTSNAIKFFGLKK